MLFVDSICRHQKSVDPQKWSLVDGENFFKDALGSDSPRQRRKRCFDRAWIQQCSLLGLEGMLSSKGGRLMLRLMNEDWTALENLGRWVHCCFSSLRQIETINFQLSHGDQDSWRGWNARDCIVSLMWLLADPFEVGGVLWDGLCGLTVFDLILFHWNPFRAVHLSIDSSGWRISPSRHLRLPSRSPTMHRMTVVEGQGWVWGNNSHYFKLPCREARIGTLPIGMAEYARQHRNVKCRASAQRVSRHLVTFQYQVDSLEHDWQCLDWVVSKFVPSAQRQDATLLRMLTMDGWIDR